MIKATELGSMVGSGWVLDMPCGPWIATQHHGNGQVKCQAVKEQDGAWKVLGYITGKFSKTVPVKILGRMAA